jgi:hypothetical protein
VTRGQAPLPPPPPRSTTIDDGEARHLLAGLDREFSDGAIHRLTDAQWWTLAAFISQWVDLNEDSDIFVATHRLASLPRTGMIAAIIVLLATGQLAVELTVPKEVLTREPLPAGAGLGLGLAAMEAQPQCTAEEVKAIQALVASKLEVIESAAARVAPGTEVH